MTESSANDQPRELPARVEPNPDAIVQRAERAKAHGAQPIAVLPGAGSAWRLTGVGEFAWYRLVATGSPAAVIDEISTHYGIDAGIVHKDVAGFVAELIDADLLRAAD
jgi:hypothetical protein